MSRPSPSLDPAAFMLGPALLFCPGDRPDRFVKATGRADGVIVDLEDAVVPERKAEARQNIVQSLNWEEPGLDPARTLVRVNSPALSGPEGELSEDCLADLEALEGTELKHIVIPKCEDAACLDAVARRLPHAWLIPQIETPGGVLRAEELARHPAAIALFWGTEDLIAGLGGTTSRRADGALRDVIRHSRERILLAAGASGVPAIDTIHTSIRDAQRLAAEAENACASGFIAKACIHPHQVEPVRTAYTPDASAVEWAKALLVEFQQQAGVDATASRIADPRAVGTFGFRGEMVDAPVVLQAQRVLYRYDATRVHHEETSPADTARLEKVADPV